MAATDFQTARIPLGVQEFPVKNTDAVAMVTGQVVKLDTAHLMSASQGQVGVLLCTVVTDRPLGIVIEAIPVNGQGRMQIVGAAWAIAAAAITAGSVVGASGATAGDVIAYTATDPYIGVALTAAVNAADPVLVLIQPGTTA
jgi:hypothetical protein